MAYEMASKSLRIAAEYFNDQRVHDENVQLAIAMVNPLAKALGQDLNTAPAWICRNTINALVKAIQDGSIADLAKHALLVEPLKKVWLATMPLQKIAPDARGNELTHAQESPKEVPNAQEGQHPEGGGAAYTDEDGDTDGDDMASAEQPTGGEGAHADGVHPGGAPASVAHSTTNMFPDGHGAPVHMFSGPVMHNTEHANEMMDAHNKAADAYGDTVHSHAVYGGYDHNGKETTAVVSHMMGEHGSVMLHSKTDGEGVGSTAAHMMGAHHEHASTKLAKSIGAKPAHHAAKAALHKFHAHMAYMTGTPMGKTVNPKSGDLQSLTKMWSDAAREAAAAAKSHGFNARHAPDTAGQVLRHSDGQRTVTIKPNGDWIHKTEGVQIGSGSGASDPHGLSSHLSFYNREIAHKSLETHPLLKAGPAYYELLIKKEFSDAKRKELASSGAAMPDGSYPIENTSDLDNAVKAFGRSPDEATKNHIKKRAAALGATSALPDKWK